MNAPLGGNPPRELLEALLDALDAGATDDDAHAALDAALDGFSVVETAALGFDYEWWCREKQRIPRGRPRFSTWGFLTGRGFGKTWAIAGYLVDQIIAGRATRIALIAQGEDETLEFMVHGNSGLIAMSPPWCKPVMKGEQGQPMRLVWPNGAQAFIYTANKPGSHRGPEHDYAWCSEFIAWAPAKRDEALSNVELGLRLGDAVMLWDTTSKRKHPIIRERLELEEAKPDRHVVIRGHSRENIDNLNREKLEELITKLAGTQRGKEELAGEYLDEDEAALWEQDWITGARAALPAKLDRRAIGIDPSTSDRADTDHTGFAEGAIVGAQAYVIADDTGPYAWEAWGMKAVTRYVDGKCAVIVIERNKGGDACTSNIRFCALEYSRQREEEWQKLVARGRAPARKPVTQWRVELVKPKQGKRVVTRHVPGVIYVKEKYTRLKKHERARPVATAYKHGRVSHVEGADLTTLEHSMTTWEPGEGKSPDDIDALCYMLAELIDLAPLEVDFKKGIEGLGTVTEALKRLPTRQRRQGVNRIAELLGKGEWRSTL